MLMSEGGIARSPQTCMLQTQKESLYIAGAVLHTSRQPLL